MRYLLYIALTILTSCQTTFDKSEIEQEIIDMTNLYNRVWETVDMDSVATYHSDDLKYYWHGYLAANSNQEFVKELKRIMSATKEWSMKIDNLDVQVLDENTAIIGFNSTSSHLITNDNQEVDYGIGAFTYVWNRTNGVWKLVHIHESALEEDNNME